MKTFRLIKMVVWKMMSGKDGNADGTERNQTSACE